MTCICNPLFPSVPTPTTMLSKQRARQKLERFDDTAVNGHHPSDLLSGPLTPLFLFFITYFHLSSLQLLPLLSFASLVSHYSFPTPLPLISSADELLRRRCREESYLRPIRHRSHPGQGACMPVRTLQLAFILFLHCAHVQRRCLI